MRHGQAAETTQLTEYWTLGKGRGGWKLLSVEQRAEGEHHLHGELVATPWSDTGYLRDEALVEGASADKLPEGTKASDVADLEFVGESRAAGLDLSVADGRFAPDVVEVAVRRAVSGVGGGGGRRRRRVTRPGEQRRDRRAPPPRGPEREDPPRRPGSAGAPGHHRRPRSRARTVRLTVELEAEGRRYLEDRDSAAVLSGSRSRMIRFTERWTLALDGSDEQPWRIVGAHPALTSRRALKVTGRASR